jgi:hypothetical protein
MNEKEKNLFEWYFLYDFLLGFLTGMAVIVCFIL